VSPRRTPHPSFGATGPAVAVRDSKHPDGPQLAFAPDIWKTFTKQLKATT